LSRFDFTNSSSFANIVEASLALLFAVVVTSVCMSADDDVVESKQEDEDDDDDDDVEEEELTFRTSGEESKNADRKETLDDESFGNDG